MGEVQRLPCASRVGVVMCIVQNLTQLQWAKISWFRVVASPEAPHEKDRTRGHYSKVGVIHDHGNFVRP